MWETVKVVKGHAIYRMKGSRGVYHVNEAAVEFINSVF